jgi:hypothetical protein
MVKDWSDLVASSSSVTNLLPRIDAERKRKADAREAANGNANAAEVGTRLRPLCIHDLLKLDIPVREMILGPIIPEKGLVMLYASRGLAKLTWLVAFPMQ